MNIFTKILLGTVLSFYLFPIGFTFLPPGLNTKMILAFSGVFFFFLDNVKLSNVKLNMDLGVSIFIATLFSVICYFSADFNVVDDYSYASYIVSFFTWLGGAYCISWFFRQAYGEFSFRELVFYLLAVCLVQCVSALLMDSFPLFKTVVNSLVLQGQDFAESVRRLYGIGASLDNAGVRFSIVLVMVSALLMQDDYVRDNSRIYFLLLIGFFIVGVIGNMISRTTVVGFGIGFAYILCTSKMLRVIINVKSFKTALIFVFVLACIIGFAIYIYNTSVEYRTNFRFAFEGFFNWFETGEWKTSSTDKLSNEMWIWPTTTEGWIIGTGKFGNFVYSTDVGYCRFILYCGLIGFSVFASLFIYNALAFALKIPKYSIMFLIIGSLSFIIWIKVATDIFFIYALFYCIDSFSTIDKSLVAQDEDRI